MVKVKNTRPLGSLYNPFSNVNQHGVALLDAEGVQQLCLQSGKSVGGSSLSEFTGTTLFYGSTSDDDGDAVPVEVEVHFEVSTQQGPPVPVQLVKNVSNTIVEMACTKQTVKKQGQQGTPARFGVGSGGKGKGKGKAAKQLALQTAGVSAHHYKCKDRCPVMHRGSPDDASTGCKKRYMPGMKSLLEIAYY